MLKKKALILPALCAAVLPVFTLPADAKLEADPQFGDVVVLHSNPYPAGSGGDPLCTFINGMIIIHAAFSKYYVYDRYQYNSKNDSLQ